MSRETKSIHGARSARGALLAANLTVLGMLLVACGSTLDPAALEEQTQIYVAEVATAADAVELLSLDGATVSGTVRIVVEAPKKVTEVHFFLDAAAGALAVERTAPFAIDLDTTALADGSHALVAATPSGRKGGLRELSSATFTVRNAASEPDPTPDPTPSPIDGVRIRVGEDARAVVARHPAGTTFVFEAGVHRLGGSITPRNDDVYVGEPGAVLSGARLLTSFVREQGLWVATGQTQQGWIGPGECSAEAPRCRNPEELFLDDVPLRHVDALGKVGPGTWYFDYAADKIYLYDSPTGHRVETSVVGAAIAGDAHRVTVRGLTIEKFANAAQRGAIMADRIASSETYGRDWRIEDNVVRLNHGVGIRAGSGARIVGNTVVWNGQMGISSVAGFGTLIERNEIAYNNFAGYSNGWEAGGTKFVKTTGLVVRDNHAHHNWGPGLWTDIDNVDTLYEYNLVELNTETGIFHEISYSAVIRYNTVRYNGLEAGADRYAYVFGAGILVYTSSDVEVYGNTILGNWNGIVGLMHARGTGAYGAYELRDLYVHDNDVTMQFHADGLGPNGERGVYGVSGVAQAGGFDVVFSSSYANRFENNHYGVTHLSGHHYTWQNAGRTFSAWQSAGQDAGGAIAQTDASQLAGN